MDSSRDIRKVKCLDGLYYSFQLLEYNYSTMYESCVAIKRDRSNIIPALSKCWSFVDSVHRIREISQALPGLGGKSKELIDFLSATNIAEEYRHYIQHLRGELLKKDVNKFPVWGTLAWVDDEDNSVSHLVVTGARIDGTQYTGCVYDTVNKKWVSEVCLGVNNKSFNFDLIYEECIKFKKFVLSWIQSTYEPGIQMKSDSPIITVKLVFGSEEA